ncbi:hypothetical protein [Methylocystis rosea]|uniref:Uncharacterized protein n=1 Tax=Methylocystis rosea TaxID=173366 RepID=A0A3G8M1Y6_9HYPH|nr:hypothetical protein [Methylocystis rosea]AZG75983.1 hypothetical protein EHO51_04125 [Methylocystis rosea]
MTKNYFEPFGGGVFASGRKTITGGAIEFSIKLENNLAPLFEKAGAKSLYALGKAIDEVGSKTKTQVTRAVAKQAGVKYGAARGVIVSRQALGRGQGEYKIIAHDVTLSLKEFSPKQTAKGVSAAPWGKRSVFPHTFIGPNGHVFAREMVGNQRAGRLPISKLFGPAIPKELVKGETEATFYRVSAKLFDQAVEKWLTRVLEK